MSNRRLVYKPKKTISEQIEHLEKNKRVVFNTTNKTKAASTLYMFNYINVISPYKRNFAEKNPDGTVKRDANNNHIYLNDTDFTEYANAYVSERSKYGDIYTNLMLFETKFNSIISYETIHYYDIIDYDHFLSFKKALLINLENSAYGDSNKAHMRKDIYGFEQRMEKYDDIYLFLDRQTLSTLITIYRCIDQNLQKKVFKSLLKAKATFGYTSTGSFESFLDRVVPIRNCICHFNSIEILINYYDIKNKVPRKSSDKKSYISIINKLSVV